MIYKKTKQIPSSKKEVEIYVARCVKCECDDIKIYEYEDQFGFISTVSCKQCGNEIKINASEEAAIKGWNSCNDIPKLIDNKTTRIEILKQEIAALKSLRKKRVNQQKKQRNETKGESS